MRGILLCAVAALVAFGAAPAGVTAQPSVRYTVPISTKVPPVTVTFEGVYWPTSSQLVTTSNGTLATWNTAMYGVDLRVDTSSHWGLHFTGMTGNESNWSFPAGGGGMSLSGTDTIWSADVSYLVQQRIPENLLLTTTFRAFAGYSDARLSMSQGNSQNSTGARVGFDFTYPFTAEWTLAAGVAYSPWTTTTGTLVVPGVGSGPINAGGTAWDAAASVRYSAAGHWTLEVGYRYVREDQGTQSVSGVNVCPCHTQWQGPFFALGASF